MKAEYTLGFLCLVTMPLCVLTFHMGRLYQLRRKHAIRDLRNTLTNWWALSDEQIAELRANPQGAKPW